MSTSRGHDPGLVVLSLDGGGVRGLSSLLILKECMARLQHQLGLNKRPEVYEHFDFVGGTGTGGISAVMLGRLRIPLDRAIEHFARLGTDVFSERKYLSSSGSGAFKSTKMQQALKSIIREATGSEDERMLDHRSDADKCKTVVFAMSKNNMNAGLPRAFRSYQASVNQMPDCSVWEALCATTAHPDLFKSVDIGDAFLKESFVDGGLGCSNPLARILAEVKLMYPSRHIGCVVSIGAGHARTIHIPSFKPFQRLLPTNAIEAMRGIATDSEQEAQRMAVRFSGTPDVYFRLNVDHGMQSVELSDWERLSEVTGHTRGYIQHIEVTRTIDQLAKAIKMKKGVIATAYIDGEAPVVIGPIKQASRTGPDSDYSVSNTEPDNAPQLLRDDANSNTRAFAQKHLSIHLAALSPAEAASYDSAVPTSVVRIECTKDTRTDVLAGMNVWAEDDAAPKVYWLNGMAGTGKTTIACSLSAALADRRQLGASFFCTRVVEECRDATRIIPTIAYQLARYSRPFQHALCNILGDDPDVLKKNIQMQFKRLLKEPLLSVRAEIPNNTVVVIDALDECDEDESVQRLLETIFQNVRDLPLKFFVTSRPEPEILHEMQLRGEADRSVLHLHEIERSSVQADITLYLRKELAVISPTENEIALLVRLSEGLFIYAATAVRYIRFRNKSVNPRERLRAILATSSNPSKMSKYAELDGLYKTILKGVFREDGLERAEVGRVQLVLWTAVCVREPVTVKALSMLAGLEEENTLAVLQSLQSLLHISKQNSLVTTLHASLSDFLFTQERSQNFFCDKHGYSSLLAQQCFKIMKTELRFNICELESSCIPDELVEDLDDRINTYISGSLSYACEYWGDHLIVSTPTDSLYVLLENFLSNQLLFWIEVLNLSKPKSLGGMTLLKVQSWLGKIASHKIPEIIIKLTSDAYYFVTQFSSNPVSICTPHIYISALPFCHRSSSVFARYYWKQMLGLMAVKGTAIEHPGSGALASWDAGEEVRSVAISPDGAMIAFGGGSGKRGVIGIINRQKGGFAIRPFLAHAGGVNSVGFSPDGAFVVSGSYDRTICLWSAHDGSLIAGPFRGHTAPINSVTFSPDGAHIVSASSDRTICVWSARCSDLVLGPLLGHAGSVESVSFSPGGTYIASGSEDNTVCVWNAHDGKIFLGPLQGHMGLVKSVQFSPCGAYIASGSYDRTICVWSARNGSLVAGPFKGHIGWINSVAFSRDGTRIVSGSDDHTICVWNVQDSSLVAHPFRGHTGLVKSVAFSPEGTHIISGSNDRTICIWDTGTRDNDIAFRGHTGWVNSVAFSPDATHIVSGSYDSTTCVWDAHNGRLFSGPFKYHTASVNTVAFSPDSIYIVSGSDDKTICTRSKWGKEVVFRGHNDPVNSVAFSPTGTHIVSGSYDQTIRIWNVQNGKPCGDPLRVHTASVNSVAFSPDGTRIVSGSTDEMICVWTLVDGAAFGSVSKVHTGPIKSVAFSPDGARIVSGSADRTICVWSTRDDRAVVGRLKGHGDSVNAVGFSPDGTCIVSGSDDGAVCMWDMQGSNPLTGLFRGHTRSVNSVALSPDGTQIVSSSNDCSIRFTQLETVTVPPILDGEWTVRGSGWVVNHNDQYLFWVPQHLRSSLPHPHNPLVIGLTGALQVDYSNVILGEGWYQRLRNGL